MNPHLKNTEQNDNPTENQNTKPTATKTIHQTIKNLQNKEKIEK